MSKEKIMKKEEIEPMKKQPYVKPNEIVTYEKDELIETIKAQGEIDLVSIWHSGVSSGDG
jgi:hypothetical protein